jgi:hypothetical protein
MSGLARSELAVDSQLPVVIALGAGISENLKLTVRSRLPTETI